MVEINQQVAMLPETANVESGGWILRIRDHTPTQSLFDWMLGVVWHQQAEQVFPEMKKHGIEWYGLVECMANEIEYEDEKFINGLYWMTNWGHTLDDCKKIASEETGQKIRKDLIHAIRHCTSYKDFAEKFARWGNLEKDIKARTEEKWQ